MSEDAFIVVSDSDCNEGGVSEVKNGDAETVKEEAWTVSTKTRRLAPAFTLSRKDLGADTSRPIVKDYTSPKKKVIRFSREDMLRLWRPSRILSVMTELPDIVSIPSLDPMSLRPLEQDEVFQLWNLDKDRAKDAINIRGRGKGRGKGPEGEYEEEDNEWMRGHHNADGIDGPWDDVDGDAAVSRVGGVGGGLDLADFAAAALKFRSDTRNLGQADSVDGSRSLMPEEDEMDRLFREQKDCSMADALEEDNQDQDPPEWADAYGTATNTHSQSQSHYMAPDQKQNQDKRNLLFQTLQIQNASTYESAQSEDAMKMRMSSMPTMTPVPPMTTLPTPLPILMPESWYYRDPQNTVQGPYEQDSMRQWHEARYFTHDLPIKLRHWQDFHPLGAVFPDPNTAFHSVSALIEPMTAMQRHALSLNYPLPPMRSLQSEIMDIDIILRQQQEQRQRQQLILQQQQQQQQQQALLEQRRHEEQRRLQVALMLAAEEQAQLKVRQQMFEAQEKEKNEKIRLAQIEFEREEQLIIQQQAEARQQQLALQHQEQLLLQQQLQLEKLQEEVLQEKMRQQRQEEIVREQQLHEQRQQAEQQQIQHQQEILRRQVQLQQQQLLQQQAAQKVPPPPSGSAWGAGTVSSPSLSQIQTEESKTKQQQQSQAQQQSQQAQNRGSSQQLMSLLGLGGPKLQSALEPSAWESVASPAKQVATSASKSSAASPPPTSLKEILRQEQAKSQEQAQIKHHQAQLLMQQQVRSAREAAASESATAAVIAAASWSAVGATGETASRASNTAKPALSLRDIMQLEEASSAASQSSAAESNSPFVSAPRPAPGSWAAKASSLSGGASASVSAAQMKQAPTSASKSSGGNSGAKKSAAAAVAGVTATSAGSSQQKAVTSAAVAVGPSFGPGIAGSAAELSEWCVAQLSKIRASEGSAADPREFFGVLEYCATLQSAVEVRETFSAYLGSTILVSNFASEFLKKRDGQSSAPSAVTMAAVVGSGSGQGQGQGAGTKKKGKKGNTEF